MRFRGFGGGLQEGGWGALLYIFPLPNFPLALSFSFFFPLLVSFFRLVFQQDNRGPTPDTGYRGGIGVEGGKKGGLADF